jgi:alkylation response protein AidB-like acyl-CoA dehydrogenase
MNYELSQEQQILKDAARSFFSKECPLISVREMAGDARGHFPELWRKMAELGWVGLLIPEKYGGCEGSFLDLAVLMNEMGYRCSPGPFFASAVLGALTVLDAGSDEQKKAILPGVASGDRILTLAWIEPSGTYAAQGISLAAEEKGSEFLLSGTKLFVPFAKEAGTLICAARTQDFPKDAGEGVSLFLLDAETPGLKVQPLDTMAGDQQCEVTLDQVRVSREDLLGELHQGWPVLEKVLLKAAVAKAAEMSGGAQKVLDLVIPHAKERVQFDRPIGSFQAVQHHCANILTYVDTVRFMTHQAAWRISEGLPFEKEAAMCKAWVSDSYRRLVALGHQVLGGMGFMEEHDLPLYFVRAKAAELAMGDADFHREIVAQHMGL